MDLVGVWTLDETDWRSLADLGDLLLEFREDGSLDYVIRGSDSRQIAKLRYWIEGNMLVTDQPSAPQIERTLFSLSDDGVLTLTYNGMPSRFKRCGAHSQDSSHDLH
jgi:hypothetical protein